nr:unknown [Zea mays]
MGRLQDSNAVLTHFNEYSERCFVEVSGDFASKTRLLKSMKADLDHIFTKLREMKARLAATYPDAFPNGAMSKTMDQRPDLESPLD